MEFDNWRILYWIIIFNFWVDLGNSFRNKILLLLPIVLILENFVLIEPFTLMLRNRKLILIVVRFLNGGVYSERILGNTKSIHACIEGTFFYIFKNYLVQLFLFFCFFFFSVKLLLGILILAGLFLMFQFWRWSGKSDRITAFFESINLNFFQFFILFFFFILYFYLFNCLFT